ncbi:MAG TPA: PucR family transcriptional regulator ligand-binding domain-containing protein [Bacillota bacterium]|nr:PucR family transcriptional regulator ligand-binding domain-containing protein [Bacillota bacterium]
MALTVKEVLQMEAFSNCTMLTGNAGLDNEIRWVNILELLDDLRYIEEGDFLITTAYDFDFKDTAKQERLIELFAGNKLAALAVQTGHYIEAIPPTLIKLAGEHGIPLIEIPADTSFKSLTKALLSELMRQDKNMPGEEAALQKKGLQNLISQNRLLMQKLLSGESAEGLREHLRPLQISPHANFYLVMVSSSSGRNTGNATGKQADSAEMELLEQSLIQLLIQHKLPFLAGSLERNLVFLVQPLETAEEQTVSQVDHLLQELSLLYPRVNLYAGMSRCHSSLQEISQARSEACRALEAAELGLLKNKRLLRHNDLGPYRLLLEVQNLEVLQATVADTIGPLLQYDHRSGGDLVKTLASYLKHLNISAAATELFIHRHTLRYRLKQIEELTGLDFADTEQVFQLFLALKVYDYLKARKLS